MKNLTTLILLSLAILPGAALAVAESPEQAARRFEKELGAELIGVSCTQVDTDNDGYVTCTVSLKNGDDPRQETIQCAAIRAVGNDGCETQTRGAEGCKAVPLPIVVGR